MQMLLYLLMYWFFNSLAPSTPDVCIITPHWLKNIVIILTCMDLHVGMCVYYINLTVISPSLVCIFVFFRNILKVASYYLSYPSETVIITDFPAQHRLCLPARLVILRWTARRPSFIKYTAICQLNNQLLLAIQINHCKLL